MKNQVQFSAFLMVLVMGNMCQGQNTTAPPKNIVRNIAQDRNGDIWLTSWEGVFRYNGQSFTNMTHQVSDARFFSVLEDRKGNLWFGSIGSGVYRYNGQSFQNLTTKDGLLNNEVGWIYEAKNGYIWFGVNGGASCYDGKVFRNYMINGDVMYEAKAGVIFPNFTRPPNEVTSIVEDKSGKIWFGTRGKLFVYDGKAFTVMTHVGNPFLNVRSIITDRKGNVWLGGNNGLWRYDGVAFTNFTHDFVGYIHEDSKGNIWTSSETPRGWVLSRYDQKSLFMINQKPITTQIMSGYEANKKMIFGILEAKDGSIWFGSLDGVYRYDGFRVHGFGTNVGRE